MRIKYTDGRNSDFIHLCAQLDNFLNELVGGEVNRLEYLQHNKLDDINDAFVIYDEWTPIGCSAFKEYDRECAEVKRVFVCEEYRSRGIGKKLMAALEDKAREKGYKYLILESGEPLAAAMKLYLNIGFYQIPNYGQYKEMPDSICMKKSL